MDHVMDDFTVGEFDDFLFALDTSEDCQWADFSNAPLQWYATMVSQDQTGGVPASTVEHGAPPTFFDETEGEYAQFDLELSAEDEKSVTVTGRKRITSSEWEQKREIIRHLYIDQEKTLAATRQILLGQYGFFASEKAYKAKIKEWNLIKNLKQRQIKFMLKMAKKRKDEEGKETAFFYHGTEVPGAKILRYSKTINADSFIKSVPSYVNCITPQQVEGKASACRTRKAKRQDFRQDLEAGQCTRFSPSKPVDPEQIEDYIYGPSTNAAVFELQTRLIDIQYTLSPTTGSTTISPPAYPSENSTNLGAFAYDMVSSAYEDFKSRGTHMDMRNFAKLQLRVLYQMQQQLPSYNQYSFLPLRSHKAQCLIVLERYVESEVELDGLLLGYESLHQSNRQDYLSKISFPVLLLGKTYLAQRKHYALECLLNSTLEDFELGNAIQCGELSLRKLVLISRIVRYAETQQKTEPCSEKFLVRMLEIIESSPQNCLEGISSRESWKMGLLEILRFRYGHQQVDSSKLKITLSKMKPLVERAVRIQQRDGLLIDIAAQGMLESYRGLGMRKEEQAWLQLPEQNRDRYEKIRLYAHGQPGFFDNEYTLLLMRRPVMRFLQEWPGISLLDMALPVRSAANLND